MSSILTNNGAMVALQTLKGINKNMAMTQSEISTGKSVATAKDNAAVWAISKVMESDVKGFEGISDSLSLGESTVAVARNASESITDLLTEIKGKIVAAQEENVDRDKIQTDINALTEQVKSVVGAAQFNGLNLIDGSASSPVKILSSLDRSGSGVSASHIEVDAQNLSVTTPATAQTMGTTALANAAAADVYIDGGGTSLFEAEGTTAWDTDTATQWQTTAKGASETVTIGAVKDGMSYEVRIEGMEVKTADGGTTTAGRSFKFVAGDDTSTEGVAKSLVAQMNSFFGAATDSGYTAAVNNNNEIVITNGSATGTNADLKIGVRATDGGTAGSTADNAGLGGLQTLDVTTDDGATQALTAIEGLIQKSIDSAAAFGSVQKRIGIQSDFVGKLSDSLKSGIGSMVDADMEETSARLQALQVQQQLGTQSLSIANQAPQALLSLFR